MFFTQLTALKTARSVKTRRLTLADEDTELSKNVRLAGLAALLLSSSAGHAGGLWITEYGQPTMGRAGAGEEAGTDDATMALLNPAAMSRIKERSILTSATGSFWR